MDAISEARLKEVHPELARRIHELAAKCEANGFPIRVTCGMRTWSEQDAMYNEGRVTPGPIITRAQGGWSAHQFGYAADIVPGKEGVPEFTPDWNAMDVVWKSVLLMAASCGLDEGACWRSFPDQPHLYLQGVPADPTEEMRDLYRQGGMDAVWDMIEKDYNIPSTKEN